MGVPLDLWFNDLVAEHPGAQKYRKDVERIVEMYWQEANDRVSWEDKARKLKVILDDVLDGDKRIIERRKREIESNTAHYEKASAYANLIISAGYAALLVAWSTTFKEIDRVYAMMIGALALSSLLIYIGWKILKMIGSALEISHRSKVLEREGDDLEVALIQDAGRRSVLERLIERGWKWQLFLALPTGLAAGLLLIVQIFISNAAK